MPRNYKRGRSNFKYTSKDQVINLSLTNDEPLVLSKPTDSIMGSPESVLNNPPPNANPLVSDGAAPNKFIETNFRFQSDLSAVDKQLTPYIAMYKEIKLTGVTLTFSPTWTRGQLIDGLRLTQELQHTKMGSSQNLQSLNPHFGDPATQSIDFISWFNGSSSQYALNSSFYGGGANSQNGQRNSHSVTTCALYPWDHSTVTTNIGDESAPSPTNFGMLKQPAYKYGMVMTFCCAVLGKTYDQTMTLIMATAVPASTTTFASVMTELLATVMVDTGGWQQKFTMTGFLGYCRQFFGEDDTYLANGNLPGIANQNAVAAFNILQDAFINYRVKCIAMATPRKDTQQWITDPQVTATSKGRVPYGAFPRIYYRVPKYGEAKNYDTMLFNQVVARDRGASSKSLSNGRKQTFRVIPKMYQNIHDVNGDALKSKSFPVPWLSTEDCEYNRFGGMDFLISPFPNFDLAAHSKNQNNDGHAVTVDDSQEFNNHYVVVNRTYHIKLRGRKTGHWNSEAYSDGDFRIKPSNYSLMPRPNVNNQLVSDHPFPGMVLGNTPYLHSQIPSGGGIDDEGHIDVNQPSLQNTIKACIEDLRTNKDTVYHRRKFQDVIRSGQRSVTTWPAGTSSDPAWHAAFPQSIYNRANDVKIAPESQTVGEIHEKMQNANDETVLEH